MTGDEMRAQPSVEHAIPTVRILLPKRRVKLLPLGILELVATPYVIDQDVEVISLGSDSIDNSCHLVVIPVVTLNGDASPATLIGSFRRFLEARAGQERIGQLTSSATTGDEYVCPCSSQFDGYPSARAAARTGNQGNFAG